MLGRGRHSTLVVWLGARLQGLSLFAENGVAGDSGALERKLKRGLQNFETVSNAAPEIYGGGFREIFCRAGNFADAEAEVHALGEHLVVENEIVAVFAQRQAGQHLAAEGAVAGVILREFDAQEQIFERGQQAVGDVLVKRHAPEQSGAADNAGPQHDVVNAVGDHAGHRGDQQRRVLIVGVDHDDNVGTGGQSFTVTGLLVAAVPIVAVVHEGLQAQALRDFQGTVGTVVINQNAYVDQVG